LKSDKLASTTSLVPRLRHRRRLPFAGSPTSRPTDSASRTRAFAAPEDDPASCGSTASPPGYFCARPSPSDPAYPARSSPSDGRIIQRVTDRPVLGCSRGPLARVGPVFDRFRLQEIALIPAAAQHNSLKSVPAGPTSVAGGRNGGPRGRAPRPRVPALSPSEISPEANRPASGIRSSPPSDSAGFAPPREACPAPGRAARVPFSASSEMAKDRPLPRKRVEPDAVRLVAKPFNPDLDTGRDERPCSSKTSPHEPRDRFHVWRTLARTQMCRPCRNSDATSAADSDAERRGGLGGSVRQSDVRVAVLKERSSRRAPPPCRG